MRRYLPVFLGTRNHGFRYDPKLRSNAPQFILSFMILTTSCSKAFGPLNLLACHGVCEIIGMTCGGSTSSEKQPFSVKSKAMPASRLYKTCRKTSYSFAVNPVPSPVAPPTFNLPMRSAVKGDPFFMSENFGINHPP